MFSRSTITFRYISNGCLYFLFVINTWNRKKWRPRCKTLNPSISLVCVLEYVGLCYLRCCWLFFFLFLVSHFNFLFVPCGGLSWLPVGFLLHVKYTESYRIVSYTEFYQFLNQTSSPNVMQSTGRPLKDTYWHSTTATAQSSSFVSLSSES